MDTAFELSTDNRFDGLLWRKEQLAKSNDYFHEIHPVGATEVDERLTAAKVKAEAKANASADAKPATSPLPQTNFDPATTK
jgi:NADH-quinone oxidoreductase subunit I